MSDIRVRIAPSPSGYLHIGTARAALFNWLYARKNGGKFLVRIEDTDTERSSAEMVKVIIDSLKWLGLESDEPLVYQSNRYDLYKQYVAKLVQSGKAYHCWCSPETLKQKQEQAIAEKRTSRYDRTCYHLSESEKQANLASGKPAAIRLFVDDGATTFNDLVLGELKREHTELDDFVIARSDGRAVYNMAVVVDDHQMGISHVIRGNDHVANTFKQILIYRGLGFDLPQFAHLPLILAKDRSKMSKRHGAVAVTDYAKLGYLKEAVVNFIALLGWSPGDDREVMTLPEMIESFSLNKINSANAIFDLEKLNWMNGEYIRHTPDHVLVDLLRPFFAESGLATQLFITSRWDYMTTFVRLLKERCHLLTDFTKLGYYFFIDEFTYDEKGVGKHFAKPGAADKLRKLHDNFAVLPQFNVAAMEIALRQLAESMNVSAAELIHPTRLALSGLTGGPSLFEMMELLGKERCLARISKAIAFIEKNYHTA
jgi:glutamyl-tRNA synthetase